MNFSYGYVSVNIIALVMILFSLGITLGRWDKRGGRELSLAFGLMLIGSFCIFIEMSMQTFEDKLLWRNLSQIGLFLMPASSFNFVMVYTEKKSEWIKKLRYGNFVFAITCVLLIFTNDAHHIMRESVEMLQLSSGMVIRVQQTLVGKIAVTLNTLMSVTGLVSLWVYMRTTSKNTRNQVRMVLIGFLIPIAYTYAKSSILNFTGIEIPTPVSFLIGIVVILFGMYKYDFMSISPVARDWVVDEIHVGMIFCNLDGVIVDTNRYVDESIADDRTTLRELISRDSQWEKALLDCSDIETEIDGGLIDGAIHSIKVHRLEKNNKPLGTVSLIRDITLEKQMERELIDRAEKDSMTHVFNRRTYEEKVTDYIMDEETSGSVCGFAIIDIDYFKQINDTYGHQIGDKVIKEIVSIISSNSRGDDLIGRLGGDEFTIFITGTDETNIIKILERIRSSVEAYKFVAGNQSFNATLSMGAVIKNIGFDSFETLYKAADSALYESKLSGRNRLTYKMD